VIAPSEESPDGHPAGPSDGHPSGPPAGPPAGTPVDHPASTAVDHPADNATSDGTDDPRVESSAAERLIFFSDAVVAIAITLLALALPVPAGFDGMTNSQLLRALANNWDEYFPFLISFVVIANHWTAHRRIFRYVNRLNGQVTVANLVWLLMMIVTPFATRVIEGDGGFGVRFTLYAVVQIIASACLLVMSIEVARGNLLRPEAPESARHPDHAPSVALIIAFLISIPVSFYTEWAFAIWGTVPLLAQVLRRLPGSRRRTPNSPAPPAGSQAR
jgi:uncharacterized membrane protein